MNAFEFALAVVFITTPADKLKTDLSPEAQAFLGPRIAALARQWELLDVRENDRFTKQASFAADLKSIRDRYVSLLGAPKFEDVERFPDRRLAQELRSTNRRYRYSLCLRGDLLPDQLTTVLAETDRLYDVYSAVYDAQCDFFYVWYRRQNLAILRDLIGRRAFAAGQLPFHLPRVRLP